MQLLTTFFEDCNYQVTGKMEVYFYNALYIVFKMMGFYVQVERATARGRIDVVVTTKDYIYSHRVQARQARRGSPLPDQR